MGIYRAHCNPVNLDKPYRFNERFRVKAYPPECWNRVTKDVNFKEVPLGLSREYRTVFGPHFRSNTQMPNCNNDGIRGAVRRLTCAREPEIMGLHERLRDNQYEIEEYLGHLLLDWKNEFKQRLIAITRNKLDSVNERNLWCDAPHIKRSLRRQTRMEIIQYGRSSLKNRVKIVDYKCKTGELLPVNKYPRAIGDLTCPGSTALGYFMDWVKEAFQVPYLVNGSTAQFIKTPDHSILQEVFTKLIYSDKLTFVYFSDDSCISVPCTDGTLMANLDISACDGSNFDPVFNILKEIMSVDSRYIKDITDAFMQCKATCVVKAPDSKEKIKLTPKGHVLYSGSVLTTTVNNMANSLIFLSIMKEYDPLRPLSKMEMKDMIVNAAFRAGFILKIDECTHHSGIQFLKHSPAIVNNTVIPYLNIGTMLRGFGTYCGDLPGRKRLGILKRAQMFNSDVIKSWKHAGNTSIHRAFKKYHTVNSTLNIVIEMKSFNSISTDPIPDEEICRRYGLSQSELDELLYYISNCRVYDRVSCSAIDKILAKDYGYSL